MDITPIQNVSGTITVPGDKSISHRSIMLGALANGTTTIENFLLADDTLSTLEAFQALGVPITLSGSQVTIKGCGLRHLKEPEGPINLGNSGTTMRLLPGILAGQNFPCCLTGDASLSTRPMERIITPLSLMGGQIISLLNDGCAPLLIRPGFLKGIHYVSPLASAQVKSCVLLAGLFAHSLTTVTEPFKSRNHTEIMMKSFGVNILETRSAAGKYSAVIKPGNALTGRHVIVPGDISSAAPFIALAALKPGSDLVIKDVGLNPTRTGFLELLTRMGGYVEVSNIHGEGEKMGDIRIRCVPLHGVEIPSESIPALIDELPLVALIAALSEGQTRVTGAKDLRNKECDRINATAEGLRRFGADITPTEDGFLINGVKSLKGGQASSFGDHRIAMMLSVAGLLSEEKSSVDNTSCVTISFPEFFDTLKAIVS